MISGTNYIGNKKSAKGENTFTTFNPQTNTANTNLFTEATKEEVHEAALLASEAFLEYSQKSGSEKAHFLRTIADEIEALGIQLLDVYMSESGLPEGRARGERGRTYSA